MGGVYLGGGGEDDLNIRTPQMGGVLVEARKIQQFSVNMVEILNKYGGGVRAGKAIMKIIGIDCGPSRAPVKIFSSSEINSLISDLQSVGFI